MKKIFSIKNITRISILGVLGAILMLMDFPIFIAPSFYKIDLSDLPCLIGAFAMGPIPGLFIQIIKILIKLLFKPTSTAFIGEIAAFIFSSSYCISASLIYQRDKNKKGAIKAIIISSVVMVVVSSLANYLFIIPAYCTLYKMPLEAIISLGSAIFPIVTNKLTFVMYCVVPFNIIKATIISVITLLLYKHISPLLKG